MLKLVTGLPGAGKTSNELWDFLHNKDYEGRPKFVTPIKGFVAADHGVTEIPHIDKWEELPEGSVVLCDEVQRYCGTDLGRQTPAWVENFAIHRHSGKDFIFLTQTPGFLHPFPRKLVQPHVNYHRPYNLGRAMRYSWESVQTDPASKTARNIGQSSLIKTNPEVFKLYTSTVLDTHKPKPPMKSLIILGLALLVAVVGIGFAVRFVLHMTNPVEPAVDPLATEAVVQAAAYSVPDEPVLGREAKPIWTEQTMKPRVASLPFTAPVYDQLTQPTDFPRVAACMSSETRGTCNCFTQQATPVDVPHSACLVYIKHGSFDPWLSGRRSQGRQDLADSPEPGAQPSRAIASRGQPLAVNVVSDSSSLSRRSKQTQSPGNPLPEGH